MNKNSYYVIKTKLRGADKMLPIRYAKEFARFEDAIDVWRDFSRSDVQNDYVIVLVEETIYEHRDIERLTEI